MFLPLPSSSFILLFQPKILNQLSLSTSSWAIFILSNPHQHHNRISISIFIFLLKWILHLVNHVEFHLSNFNFVFLILLHFIPDHLILFSILFLSFFSSFFIVHQILFLFFFTCSFFFFIYFFTQQWIAIFFSLSVFFFHFIIKYKSIDQKLFPSSKFI